MLLAKPTLPKDWIDMTVGEAYIIRDCLSKFVDVKQLILDANDETWVYPYSTGFKPLQKMLEDKHGAPVIMTNGAKQALSAIFYVLKVKGRDKMHLPSPYWALIPPLAQMHGLSMVNELDCNSYILVAPNNPDGKCLSSAQILELEDSCKEHDTTFVHDAAYYTHSYLPMSQELLHVGDLQVFSISKMFGLSGLRLGYIVCRNTDYHDCISNCIETTTVGVSNVSQIVLHDILSSLTSKQMIQFEIDSFNAVMNARNLIKSLNKDVFTLHNDHDKSYGMFGWVKTKSDLDFSKAKVLVSNGKAFGDENYIRMNLGVREDVLLEAIKRLNTL